MPFVVIVICLAIFVFIYNLRKDREKIAELKEEAETIKSKKKSFLTGLEPFPKPDYEKLEIAYKIWANNIGCSVEELKKRVAEYEDVRDENGKILICGRDTIYKYMDLLEKQYAAHEGVCEAEEKLADYSRSDEGVVDLANEFKAKLDDFNIAMDNAQRYLHMLTGLAPDEDVEGADLGDAKFTEDKAEADADNDKLDRLGKLLRQVETPEEKARIIEEMRKITKG
ncbi:MAG: hypothetical protein J6332_04965 [Abditibacteriota bacterium]|nr:hypothetical protein [Abditibacteriota bacterium]